MVFGVYEGKDGFGLCSLQIDSEEGVQVESLPNLVVSKREELKL